jgi:Ca2+-transporting ATPase
MLMEPGPVDLDAGLIDEAVDRMTARGLRVLAMAYRRLPRAVQPTARPEDAPELQDLVFLGLQGMMDPPRPGVPEAVASCRGAGIRVLMITGDHAQTARSIGRLVGMADDPVVLTGQDLERMDDATLAERAQSVTTYARVAPEHKLRIVSALRSRGEVVAVTGDGVNDAPALKAADIGISMGRGGTDVAREASDMVLADDDFVSISAAVEEGRITFDNLRKVTFFLISTNVAEVAVVVLALALGWPLPLIAVQILWLNLVTEGVQDLALAFEPGEAGIADRPPRPRGEGIISRVLWERTFLAGLVVATGSLLMFHWELAQGSPLAYAQTTVLTTIVLFEALQVHNARSERESVFGRSPFSNTFLLFATAAALSVHVAAIYFPVTQNALRLAPLTLDTWMRMAAVSLLVVPAMELHKAVRRSR